MTTHFTQLYRREMGAKPGPPILVSRGQHPKHMETDMTNLCIKTVMAALLAGSLATTAGMPAFARADGGSVDPARFQQGIEKRVDKALNGTDATQDQKKQIIGILQAAFCTPSARRTAPRCARRSKPRPSTRRRSSRFASPR